MTDMPDARNTILTCAVTGSAPLTERSAAVPVTPERIVGDCLSAAEAGAAIVHIHVRDPVTGGPSMELGLYREVVAAIRAARPDLILNLTTGPGARFVPDEVDPARAGPGTTLATPEDRVRHILELRPEICSLDVATMNFGEHAMINILSHLRRMAGMIQAAGVKPELEVFEIGQIDQARTLIAEGLVETPPLFQLCLGVRGGAPATSKAMLVLREFLPADAVWGAFGIGAASFPMLAQAMLLGGHVRVGLEDNLYLAKGRLASGNAELVARAVQIIRALGGTPAKPAQARALLGLAASQS